MRMRKTLKYTASLILASFLSMVDGAFAVEPTLTGPNVVTLLYVFVPFSGSQRTIVHGERQPDGRCSYPIRVYVPAGKLALGQKYLRVRRAVDPVNCNELLEEGIVDSNFK